MSNLSQQVSRNKRRSAVWDVRNFGAHGDGEQKDPHAIQAAINACRVSAARGTATFLHSEEMPEGARICCMGNDLSEAEIPFSRELRPLRLDDAGNVFGAEWPDEKILRGAQSTESSAKSAHYNQEASCPPHNTGAL